MKIFGHPVHMILIHFPSALLPMDLVFSGIALYEQNLSFASAAFYCTVVAVIFGWMAVITGCLDLLPEVKNKPDAVGRVLLHGGLNTGVIIGFTLIALIGLKKYPGIPLDSTVLIAVKLMLIVIMIAGNFLGGRLILKDKIGLEDSTGPTH